MNLDVVGKKLTDLAVEIEAEKGPLEFFGLFLRDNSYGLWDFAIAASWLDRAPLSSYEYVANQLRRVLTREEMTGIYKIVILEHGSEVLRSILEYFANHLGLDDVHYAIVSGAIIERSYVIVARPMAGRSASGKKRKPRKTKEDSQGKSPSPIKTPR